MTGASLFLNLKLHSAVLFEFFRSVSDNDVVRFLNHTPSFTSAGNAESRRMKECQLGTVRNLLVTFSVTAQTTDPIRDVD
jgi:hypothetical protein